MNIVSILGAELMALGARRSWPARQLQPIVSLDRRRHLYQRAGDVELRPWPDVAFLTEGPKGIIWRGRSA